MNFRELERLQNIYDEGPGEDNIIEDFDVHGGDTVALVWKDHIEIRSLNQRGKLVKNDVFGGGTHGTDDYVCGKFNPNGTLFAVGYETGEVELYKIHSGHLIQSFQHPDRDNHVPVTSIEFHPNNKRRISITNDKLITTWTLDTHHATIGMTIDENKYEEGLEDIQSVKYHPNGKELLLIDNTGIKIINAENGDLIRELSSEENQEIDAAYSPDGKYIALSFFSEKCVKLWDTTSHKFSEIVINNINCKKLKYIDSHKLVCQEDEILSVWLVETGLLYAKFQCPDYETIRKFEILNDRIVLFTYVDSNQLNLFRIPKYNYSKIKKKMHASGVLEEIIASNAHPMMERDSPVQDAHHFKRLFERHNKTRYKLQQQELASANKTTQKRSRSRAPETRRKR